MITETSQTVPAPTPFRSAIAEHIRSKVATLDASASHLLAASGKGVRPMCLRLVGQAFSPQGHLTEAHETLGQAIELVHTGSLIHDDILDGAPTRRGVEAVHVKWDAKVAVLAGDYLLAQATRTVSALGDPYLNTRLAEVISDLCEGELLQDEQARRPDATMEQYLERIAKKTASPFELAAEGGALLSHAGRRASAGARRFGFHLGRLFQLVDDLLDWTQDEQALGKPVGQDLACGVITLPVLVALGHAATGPALRPLLTPYPEHVGPEIKALVTHPEAWRETLALVEAEGERARQWLLEFPEGEARDTLLSMVDGLLGKARAVEAAR